MDLLFRRRPCCSVCCVVERVRHDSSGTFDTQRNRFSTFKNLDDLVYLPRVVFQEDPDVNRLEESLNLFEQIVNNIFFRDASFVLLLNKFDLFREKILYSNRHLRLYFPDYKGKIFYVSYSTAFFLQKNCFVCSKYSWGNIGVQLSSCL